VPVQDNDCLQRTFYLLSLDQSEQESSRNGECDAKREGKSARAKCEAVIRVAFHFRTLAIGKGEESRQ